MKIIIHCSFVPFEDASLGYLDSAEKTHQYHLNKGWDGIGYHYFIKRNGEIQHGRPEYWMGAHCKGHNSGSIGICLSGRGEYTNDQLNSLRAHLRLLEHRYGEFELYGHRDLDPNKDCPMFDVREWYEN